MCALRLALLIIFFFHIQNPRATIRFKEDFDFEAMNEKFNKKEVWDFFSKNSKAEADDDDKKMADDDVKGKAKEVHVKDDNKVNRWKFAKLIYKLSKVHYISTHALCTWRFWLVIHY